MDSPDRIQQIRVRGEGPGLDATIEEIRASGICGCGREHPHGGRCAWKREHGKRRNGSSGAEVAGGGSRTGVTKPVKTVTESVKKLPRVVSKPAPAPVISPAVSEAPSCHFSVELTHNGTELKIEGSSLAELRMLLDLICR